MPPLDDRRRMKAAIEQSAPGATKGHEGREPSDPPIWPQTSSPSIVPKSDPPAKLEKSHKSLTYIWGSLVVIASAVAAGWTARSAFIKPIVEDAVKDALKPLQADQKELRQFQETNQRANEASFAGIKTDIDWLKRKDVLVQQQPLTHKPSNNK